MHKYMLEIVIDPLTDGSHQITLPLPDTTFIAVSAYQSSELIKLKITNNPFANAFKHQIKRNTLPPSPVSDEGSATYSAEELFQIEDSVSFIEDTYIR